MSSVLSKSGSYEVRIKPGIGKCLVWPNRRGTLRDVLTTMPEALRAAEQEFPGVPTERIQHIVNKDGCLEIFCSVHDLRAAGSGWLAYNPAPAVA